jgi:hypothetical protein
MIIFAKRRQNEAHASQHDEEVWLMIIATLGGVNESVK